MAWNNRLHRNSLNSSYKIRAHTTHTYTHRPVWIIITRQFEYVLIIWACSRKYWWAKNKCNLGIANNFSFQKAYRFQCDRSTPRSTNTTLIAQSILMMLLNAEYPTVNTPFDFLRLFWSQMNLLLVKRHGKVHTQFELSEGKRSYCTARGYL